MNIRRRYLRFTSAGKADGDTVIKHPKPQLRGSAHAIRHGAAKDPAVGGYLAAGTRGLQYPEKIILGDEPILPSYQQPADMAEDAAEGQLGDDAPETGQYAGLDDIAEASGEEGIPEGFSAVDFAEDVAPEENEFFENVGGHPSAEQPDWEKSRDEDTQAVEPAQENQLDETAGSDLTSKIVDEDELLGETEGTDQTLETTTENIEDSQPEDTQASDQSFGSGENIYTLGAGSNESIATENQEGAASESSLQKEGGEDSQPEDTQPSDQIVGSDDNFYIPGASSNENIATENQEGEVFEGSLEGEGDEDSQPEDTQPSDQFVGSDENIYTVDAGSNENIATENQEGEVSEGSLQGEGEEEPGEQDEEDEDYPQVEEDSPINESGGSAEENMWPEEQGEVDGSEVSEQGEGSYQIGELGDGTYSAIAESEEATEPEAQGDDDTDSMQLDVSNESLPSEQDDDGNQPQDEGLSNDIVQEENETGVNSTDAQGDLSKPIDILPSMDNPDVPATEAEPSIPFPTPFDSDLPQIDPGTAIDEDTVSPPGQDLNPFTDDTELPPPGENPDPFTDETELPPPGESSDSFTDETELPPPGEENANQGESPDRPYNGLKPTLPPFISSLPFPTANCSAAEDLYPRVSCITDTAVREYPIFSAVFILLVVVVCCRCACRCCCRRPKVDPRGQYQTVAGQYGEVFSDDYSASYDSEDEDYDWATSGKRVYEMSRLGREANGGLTLEEMNG